MINIAALPEGKDGIDLQVNHLIFDKEYQNDDCQSLFSNVDGPFGLENFKLNPASPTHKPSSGQVRSSLLSQLRMGQRESISQRSGSLNTPSAMDKSPSNFQRTLNTGHPNGFVSIDVA